MKFLLVTRFAKYDAFNTFEHLIVNHETLVHGVKLLGFLKILNCQVIFLEGLKRECPSKVGIRILWILADNYIKIGRSFLVLFYHLIRLGSLMYESKIAWHLFDAAGIGEYRLFKLL